MLALTLLFAILFVTGVIGRKPHDVVGAAGRQSAGPGAAAMGLAPSRLIMAHHPSGPVDAAVRYRGLTARQWAKRFNERGDKLRRTLALTHRRWRPTVEYAIRLASAVTGVPQWQIRSVGTCESHLYPFAENGRYKGVMQLGWSPFGFSPFDPVANVLSAAMTVVHDGSWRQWECKP